MLKSNLYRRVSADVNLSVNIFYSKLLDDLFDVVNINADVCFLNVQIYSNNYVYDFVLPFKPQQQDLEYVFPIFSLDANKVSYLKFKRFNNTELHVAGILGFKITGYDIVCLGEIYGKK